MVFNQELPERVETILSPEIPLIISENQDVFCNSRGSLRLTLVRKYFGLETRDVGSRLSPDGMLTALREKMMVQELTDQDLIDITELYVGWRDTREVMPMKLTYLDQEIIDCSELPVDPQKLAEISNGSFYNNTVFRDVERYEWVFRETVKRGNGPYIRLVSEKFKDFTGQEPLNFFDETWGEKRTPMVYTTGTIEQSKMSRCCAWLHFGELWNSFITNIRNQYGKVVFFRAWQSQKNGYPHFHALFYFKDHDFTVVPWVHPNGKTSWRLPSRSSDRQKIKSAWKWGNLDILCVQNTHEAFEDMLKYITRDLEGGESDLTNAMVWFFGKQSFSFSDDFIETVWGKGKTPASLEPSDADLISAVSSYSNSELVQIEVFPIIRADSLDFDWENGADPPPKLVHELENMADSRFSLLVRLKGTMTCEHCHENKAQRQVRTINGVHVCLSCYNERGGSI